MRVLLIDTPSNAAAPSDPWRLHLPLGPMSLAKALRSRGHDAVVYDPKLSGTLRQKGDIYYRGDSFDSIEERIRSEKPGLVCVSSLFSKDADNALEICRRAKRAGVPVAVGGPHATAACEDFLVEGGPDAAAQGEGERTVLDLAEWAEGSRKLSDVSGIARRKDGGIVRNEKRPLIRDMDSIGFPDFEAVDMERYFDAWSRGAAPRRISIPGRSLPVITSRGCPYGCCFCSVHAAAGRGFRPHSPEAVLEHIRGLVARHRIAGVEFEDDNMSFDRARFERIVEGLDALRPRLSWGTPNGVRADTLLDERLLRLVKRSGCRYLTVGVESGNQEFLKKTVGKALDLRAVEEIAALCHRIGLTLNAFFIVGFPTETMSEIRDTLGFASMLNRRFGVFSSLNYAFPIKGTGMYDDCVRLGYLTEEVTPGSLTRSAYHWGRGMIRTPEFTPDLLSRLMRDFNKGMLRGFALYAASHPAAAPRLARIALSNLRSVRQHFFRV